MDADPTSTPKHRRAILVALAAALAILASACSSGPRAPVSGVATTSTATPSASILPLRRGYLEIGTYGTEIFRPAFTIDIPVSSSWGTLGETGRKVTIGGRGGAFSFLALEAGGSPALTANALVRQLRAAPGAHVGSVTGTRFAGLPAERAGLVTGQAPLKVAFGGQSVRFFPRQRAVVWLLRVGTAPVLVVLGASVRRFPAFAADAMVALDSVRFQAAP